jgi:hypothetical protein
MDTAMPNISGPVAVRIKRKFGIGTSRIGGFEQQQGYPCSVPGKKGEIYPAIAYFRSERKRLTHCDGDPGCIHPSILT